MKTFKILAVAGACGVIALTATMLAGSQASSMADEYQQLIDQSGRRPDRVRLERLISLYLEDKRGRLKESTVNGQKALWISLSDSEVAAAKKRTALAFAAARSIKEADLSPEERLDRRLLVHFTKSDLELARFQTEYFAPYRREYWYPADNGVATWRFGDLPHRSPEDYAQILARLRGIPLRLAELRETLQQGLARGIVSPQRDVEAFLRVLRADMTPDPLASRFLAAFRQFPPSISSDRQRGLADEASAIYRTVIQPAYVDLTRYVEKTYLPAAPEFFRMSALPNGAAWYDAYLRARTGVDISTDEIHRSALLEVQRAQNELETIARGMGFNGTYNEFAVAMKDVPQCAPLDGQAIRTEFQMLMRQVEKGLPRLFGVIPKTPYEVALGPVGSPELSSGMAQEGSLKMGRPGRVVVQAPFASSCSFVNVMLHEGLPGHLFQMHIASEYANMSELRHQLFLWNRTPFTEGWANYAQALTGELGLNPDMYVRAHAIAGRVFMAARTVVDTGLHAKGWSRDKAIEYYRTTVGWGPPENAPGVIDRVAFDPGGYVNYTVGQQKLVALRARAEKELGSRFDIRGFHDKVLRNGPVPFDVLDAQINDWIADQQRPLLIPRRPRSRGAWALM